jgi:hypothetical protein
MNFADGVVEDEMVVMKARGKGMVGGNNRGSRRRLGDQDGKIGWNLDMPIS